MRRLDELRLKDIPSGAELKPGARLDPLLHYAGRAEVKFVTGPGSVKVSDLKPLIDHAKQTVTSSTGELKLDYGKGVLTINAARAQGVSGALQAAGPVETRDLAIASEMELGHIVAVSLDDQPLARSGQDPAASHVRGEGVRLPDGGGGRGRQAHHQHRN